MTPGISRRTFSKAALAAATASRALAAPRREDVTWLGEIQTAPTGPAAEAGKLRIVGERGEEITSLDANFCRVEFSLPLSASTGQSVWGMPTAGRYHKLLIRQDLKLVGDDGLEPADKNAGKKHHPPIGAPDALPSSPLSTPICGW